MKVKSESEVTQLGPTLSGPMDCSPPGSSVHGILQARVLEWGAIAFSETLGVTGKVGFEVQNEAGQRITEFCQENTLVIPNTLFQQQEKTLHVDITRWSIPKSD